MPGTPSNVVALGPGELFVAEYGTTAPTDASTALNAAFQSVGFTEDGTEYEHTPRYEKINVAETAKPVSIQLVEETCKVRVELAEPTGDNLTIALNSFDAARAANAAINGQFGSDRVVLVHESESGTRTVFYRCLQVGAVKPRFGKAPAKVTLAMEFECEDPGNGLPLYKVFFAAAGNDLL